MRADIDSHVKRTIEKAQAREDRAEWLANAIPRILTLEEAEQERILAKARESIFTQPPKTPSELWHAVNLTFGFKVPLTSTHPDFNAPFEWYLKVFFNRVEDSVALASRGSGKTLMSSSLVGLSSMTRPAYKAVHAGGTQVQAQVASGYLQDFYDMDHLRPYFASKPAKFSAQWHNRSNWKIVTGSMKGVSGQHPNLLTLDEIEFWEIEALTQTFEVPVKRDEYERVWSAFSTRQRSYGAMNWLVDEAPKRGFSLYQWTVFEVMQPCVTCEAIDKEPHGDDMAREKVCVLWDACKGERAKKAQGWLPLEDARKKCIRLGGPRGREWQTQGLCNRPSSHGLVLHNFVHDYKPEGNYTRWTYVSELPWYAIHDPAEGKKSVIYFVQSFEGCTYVFDELVDQACADVTAAKQDFWEHCQRMGYPDPAVLVVDPHRTDAVATWKQGSKSGVGILHKYNADVPDISETSGVTQLLYKTIELLRQAIEDGGRNRRLYVNPEYCPKCIRGIKEYHYPTDPVTNEITSDNPDKAYSDEVDPLRYWEMYRLTKLGKSAGRVVVF